MDSYKNRFTLGTKSKQIIILKLPVYIENDGLYTEYKQNYFLSILLYLLFNKNSFKKTVYDLRTFKKKREICSCTNNS